MLPSNFTGSRFWLIPKCTWVWVKTTDLQNGLVCTTNEQADDIWHWGMMGCELSKLHVFFHKNPQNLTNVGGEERGSKLWDLQNGWFQIQKRTSVWTSWHLDIFLWGTWTHQRLVTGNLRIWKHPFLGVDDSNTFWVFPVSNEWWMAQPQRKWRLNRFFF